MQLRDYQLKALTDIRGAFGAGKRSVLYVLPTGGGKGVIIPEIVRSAERNGSRVMFLVSRRALVRDMSARLYRHGINHGLYLGANTRQTHLPVTVASIDTLRARVKKSTLPKPQLCIVDEAHLAISDGWSRVLDAMGRPPCIGFTATPIRLDGKGLGNLFDCLVKGPTVRELTDMGHLVPARLFAPSAPDLSAVRSLGGDFNQGELAEVMSDTKLVGDTVAHWRQLNEGQPTIGFAVNCRHGQAETEAFRAAGIPAEFLDGTSHDRVRDATWARLRTGETKVVWTVMIASYGFDEPCIKHGIFARPTQSLALWLQQVGRILRPFGGAKYAIVQDHAANTSRPYDENFGFIDADREWTLENRRRRSKSADEELAPESLPRVCPECKQVAKPGARYCPCGYVFAALPQREIEQVDGQLTEITERPRYSEAAYGVSNDPGIQRIIEQAKKRNAKPGQVYVLSRQLEEARTKYRDTLGIEPKPHWTSAQLSAMTERSLANQ
jgi:superfamily II DNA or RNA helicase